MLRLNLRTNKNNTLVYNEILKFVKTQWQLSDLREINNDNGCLPKDLSKCLKRVLHGSYILQVNKMYDISTSKYKQLERIRNVSNVNIEATEDVKPQIWEPKAKRMLLLHLTDGLQDVIGIEYKTISSLQDTLIPGYKIMIIGPLICRRGVMLLEESKFREIGGEVESLSISNALENVLARALDCPENPDPYNDKDRQENNNRPSPATNDFFEDDFEVNLEEVTQIEQQNLEMDNIQSTNNTSNSANTQNNLSNRLDIMQPTFVHPKNPVNDNNVHQSNNINEAFDMDDELLGMIEEDQFIASTSCTSTSSTFKNTGSTDRGKNLVKPFRVLPKEDNDYNMEDNIVVVEDTDNRIESFNKKENIKQQSDIDFPEDDFNFDDLNMLEIVEKKATIPKTKESDVKGNFLPSKLFLKNTDSVKGIKSCETFKFKTNSTNTSKASSSMQVDRQKEIGIKRPAPLISPSVIGSSKKSCIKETSSQEKGVRKISDFIKSKNFQEEIPAKICDFICDIIEETVKEITFKTVRGQFITFGKLSRKNLCWQLEGTISDKTAALDVAVASEIIERFLGFSVKEFSQKKKLAKVNCDIEHELRMACRNAEQKLKELDALLELELNPNQKAKVVNIRPLTDQQKISTGDLDDSLCLINGFGCCCWCCCCWSALTTELGVTNGRGNRRDVKPTRRKVVPIQKYTNCGINTRTKRDRAFCCPTKQLPKT
ncbi:recQ-mediated genome instability protein 1-like isoform X2 [Polistes fuscatus]|uniref:recQ-mediated genome instability protein 1-like isoform X2 n=1 Tax=Polistes fuscatus TaxID=30207 RepID=UPI001CA8997D|nr:recQ-mediated genome instability protein 1-like isoform X2 [Polistes fuscatus]